VYLLFLDGSCKEFWLSQKRKAKAATLACVTPSVE
jgi:hypothetical protein